MRIWRADAASRSEDRGVALQHGFSAGAFYDPARMGVGACRRVDLLTLQAGSRWQLPTMPNMDQHIVLIDGSAQLSAATGETRSLVVGEALGWRFGVGAAPTLHAQRDVTAVLIAAQSPLSNAASLWLRGEGAEWPLAEGLRASISASAGESLAIQVGPGWMMLLRGQLRCGDMVLDPGDCLQSVAAVDCTLAPQSAVLCVFQV